MTFQPGANLYSVAVGTRPENVEVPHYDKRAPTAQDINYPIGKEWIYINNAAYTLLGLTSSQGVTSAVWSVVTTLTGAVTTLTATSGGPIAPSAGNINILGTANQITTAGAGSSITLSIPAAFIAPGSITAAAGNITATNGNLVLNTAGNKIVSTSVGTTTVAGANSFGTVTLVAGTATVSTTAVTSSSIIYLTRMSVGATGAAALGILSVGTIVNGTSFVINAFTPANATAIAITDVSSVGYMIVN